MSRYGRIFSEETKRKISESRKGMIFTEEHKKKLSESHKGQVAWNKGKTGIYSKETLKKISESQKGKRTGKSHSFYGKKHTNESRQKMSKSMKGRIAWNKGGTHTKETKRKLAQYVGDKAPNWQGGISFEPYCFLFNNSLKKEIRERDLYQCQVCGKFQRRNSKTFPIHHIDYNKQNSRETNLATTCASCNIKVNFNREYWKEKFGLAQKILKGEM